MLGIFLIVIGGLTLLVLLRSESGIEGIAIVRDFPSSNSPEGVVVTNKGLVYVSLRTKVGPAYTKNELVELSPDGELTTVARLGEAAIGSYGLLGLCTDNQGHVFAAFASGNATHGVWKINRSGEKERLTGSEKIFLPNALTCDDQGNLFVSDSDPFDQGTTAVWRYSAKAGTFESWCDDELLQSDPENPNGGLPLSAANGIVFVPPNHIYVSNTEKSLVAHITVLPDGSSGEVIQIAGDSPQLINPDGLDVDMEGNLYTVLPVCTLDIPAEMGGPLPPVSPIVKIIPATGEIIPILDPVEFPDSDYFDLPTSLSIGKTERNTETVVICSIGAVNFEFPPGSGPKVTKLELSR